MPSIAPIDEIDKMSEMTSEFSDDLRDSAAGEQLFQTSMHVDTEEEEDGDDSSAHLLRPKKEQELRVLQGSSAVAEDLNPVMSSVESLTSIIPAEKKEAMDRFEQTLKSMIQEARDLADEGPPPPPEEETCDISMDKPERLEDDIKQFLPEEKQTGAPESRAK